MGFDPLGWTADPDFASRVLWFDALVQNVDRTWRNPNLLVWHRNIWLIHHGAALYFHHNWPTADPGRPFDAREHVLGDRATRLAEAHAELAPRITEALLREVTALVPGEWFGDRGASAYTEHLLVRAPDRPGGDPRMTEVFEYALLRVVPRVERGEAINVGVIVYSQAYRYLCAQIELDERRLLAVDPRSTWTRCGRPCRPSRRPVPRARWRAGR